MFCEKCGTPLAADQKFCQNCGLPVPHTAAQPAQEQPYASQQAYGQGQYYAQPSGQQAYGQGQYYAQPSGQQAYGQGQYYAQPNGQQAYGQGQYYAQPNGQPYYGQPYYGMPYVQPLPMKWFKFLIYFSLFAGAVINFFGGLFTLIGTQYGDMSELVYAMLPNLKTVDIIYGVLCIALAAFDIFVRFRLSGYYKNAPMLLNFVYIFSAVITIGYTVATSAVTATLTDSYGAGMAISTVSTVTSTVTNAFTSIIMVIANTVYFKKRKHLFVN